MQTKEVIEDTVGADDTLDEDDRDIFEMASLYPDTTGPPMTVWVSPGGNARHDVQIKVNMMRGKTDEHLEYGCRRHSSDTAPDLPTVAAGRRTSRVRMREAEHRHLGRLLERSVRHDRDGASIEVAAAE